MTDDSAATLIALGANLARPGSPPAATLDIALAMLPAHGLAVEAISPFFASAAVPAGSGPDFINACARIRSADPAAGPAEILAALHRVEAALGRERRTRWAPRVCDLDLLAHGQRVLPDRATLARWMALDAAEASREMPPDLLLPHPRMHERAFVLEPLAAVAPDWRHPILGTTVAEMAADLPPAARAGLRRLTREACKTR